MRIVTIDSSSYLDEEEVEQLLKACASEEERLFLLTLACTGARISEVVGKDGEDAFKPADINWRRKVIELRNLKGKLVRRKCGCCGLILKKEQKKCICGGSEIKEVPLAKRFKSIDVPDFYLEELKKYIEEKKIAADRPLFAFSRFVAYRMVRKIAKRAGIEKIGKHWVHPHTMRHSFVMRGINRDVKLKYLQGQLGHTNVSTISEYITLKKREIEEQKRKMWDTKAK